MVLSAVTDSVIKSPNPSSSCIRGPLKPPETDDTNSVLNFCAVTGTTFLEISMKRSVLSNSDISSNWFVISFNANNLKLSKLRPPACPAVERV